MTLYEFRSLDGKETIVRDLPMAKAPKIGAQLIENGKRYVRLPPGGTGVTREPAGFSTQMFAKRSPFAKEYDKQGWPYFKNMKAVREFEKRAQDAGEKIRYER